MDVTGCGYEDVISEHVLVPVQMTHSVVEQPLSETRSKDAAAAHDGQGHTYAGLYPVNPVVAGLWTTPTDLLRWASAITAAARGETPALLFQPLAIGMITRARDDAPTGLGTFVDGTGDGTHFGHGGRNEGYISEVIYFPNRRQGAAVMLNGDAGYSLLQSLLYAIGDEYGWPGYSAPEVEMQAPATALIDELVGTYVNREVPAIRVELSRHGNRLFADCIKLGVASEALQHGPDTFFTIEDFVWFNAIRSVAGTVDAIQFAGGRVDRIPSEHRPQIQ
jgi:CubicO group peptidase (beta-lactamase class C family)